MPRVDLAYDALTRLVSIELPTQLEALTAGLMTN